MDYFYLTSLSSSACNAILLVLILLYCLGLSDRDTRHKWLQKVLWASLLFYTCVFFVSAFVYLKSGIYALTLGTMLSISYFVAEFSRAIVGDKTLLPKKLFNLFGISMVLLWFVSIYVLFKVSGFYNISFRAGPVIPTIAFILYALVELYHASSRAGWKQTFLTFTSLTTAMELRGDNKAVIGFYFLWLSMILTILGAFAGARLIFNLDIGLDGLLLCYSLMLVIAVAIFNGFIVKNETEVADVGKYFVVVVLVGMSIFEVLAGPRLEKISRPEQLFYQRTSLVFEPDYNKYYSASTVATLWQSHRGVDLRFNGAPYRTVSLPFSFPFMGEAYSHITVFKNGLIVPSKGREVFFVDMRAILSCDIDKPYVAPFCIDFGFDKVRVTKLKGRVVITWLDPPSQRRDQNVAAEKERLQAALYESGRIEFSYRQLFGKEVSLTSYDKSPVVIGIADGSGVSADYSIEALPVFSGGSLKVHPVLPSRADTSDQIIAAVQAKILIFILLVASSFTILPSGIKRLLIAITKEETQKFVSERLDEYSPSGALATEQQLQRIIAHQSSSVEDISAADGPSDGVGKKKILSKQEAFLFRLLTSVEDHSSEFDFSVEKLADTMCLSPRQLHRKIITATGKTPAVFIRDYRLELAKKLLEAGAVNVTEAANSVGFRDIGHFGKLYEAKYGKTPGEILRKRRENL